MSFAALMPGSFASRPSVYLKPPAIEEETGVHPT